jgi:hypothetical protein
MALFQARELTTQNISSPGVKKKRQNKKKMTTACAAAASSLQKDCYRRLTKKKEAAKKKRHHLCSCGFQSPEGLLSAARRYLYQKTKSFTNTLMYI